jgi:hypothetical protein
MAVTDLQQEARSVVHLPVFQELPGPSPYFPLRTALTRKGAADQVLWRMGSQAWRVPAEAVEVSLL